MCVGLRGEAADRPYLWSEMIEAAGGVVWRRTAKGCIRVLLVHRPRYSDWSLPKGKLEPGEPALTGALREVREETGLRCEVGPELAEVRYVDRKGREKRVRYWAMEPVKGRFRPNHEVDKVRWTCVEEAASTLTYPHDADVVQGLRQILRSTAV